MAFDIRQRVLDSDGMPREKIAHQYKEQLMELFEQSPEGQTLQDEGIESGWASMMIDFGLDYLGKTPPQMSPGDLREILFDLFPRKVSAEADEAPDIIRELQLFWQFLQREFSLENAAACLKVLDNNAVRELKEEMSNPANFGIAKSFVMMGQERGFDMTSEEDMNAWMATYNAELATGIGPRIPLPGERSPSARKVHGKLRRKMARESRRRNRKKK
ncbi:MAG: hypothetical protein ACJ8DI_35710 [Ktedonobacteraceae bacterium]